MRAALPPAGRTLRESRRLRVDRGEGLLLRRRLRQSPLEKQAEDEGDEEQAQHHREDKIIGVNERARELTKIISAERERRRERGTGSARRRIEHRELGLLQGGEYSESDRSSEGSEKLDESSRLAHVRLLDLVLSGEQVDGERESDSKPQRDEREDGPPDGDHSEAEDPERGRGL